MKKQKTFDDKLEDALNEIAPEIQNDLIEYVSVMNISLAIIATNGSRNVKALAKALYDMKGFPIKESIANINRMYPRMVEQGLILHNGTLTMEATVNAMIYRQEMLDMEEDKVVVKNLEERAGPGLDYVPHFGEPGKA